jgi:hypothetical protein
MVLLSEAEVLRHMHPRTYLALATLALASTAFAQVYNAPPDIFQVSYVSNLNKGDSVINITNTGSMQFTHPTDNLCINVYTFDASEEMLSCCACLVTPNGLVSLSAQNDLIPNTLSPTSVANIVIKLVATDALNFGINFCGPGNIDPDGAILAPGMRAWSTNLHALPSGKYGLTENDFQYGGLSVQELTHLTTFCEFINQNGSGFGICKGCRAGGLAGDKQE